MTEKEYIAKELILSALENAGGCDGSTEWDKGYDAAIDAAIEIAGNIPAVDVAPVKHGYWKRELMSPKIGLYGYICSNCNKLIYVGIGRYMTYCGNCGAKMDGGD